MEKNGNGFQCNLGAKCTAVSGMDFTFVAFPFNVITLY